MVEIRVETNKDGNIVITQPNPQEDNSVIFVTPDQVNVLIKWLREAKKEIK